MLNVIAWLFGTASAVMGVLIHRPDKDGELRQFQIGLNELSWFPALLGGIAVLLGLSGKRRSWWAIIAGALGLGASLWPFMQHRAATEDMESAMRAGLGENYAAQIPPSMARRLSPNTWSFANATGARERSSQARITKNIEYAAPDGVPLKLDIYQPLGEPVMDDLYPVVIVIEGGGWRHQDRGHWFEPHKRYLASQGYIVFDVQHRLAPTAKWPAQLQDINCAILWVKNHAAEYRLDPNRIAIFGRSSGGHLALMAGLRAADSEAKVQAIVLLYALTDLRFQNLHSDSPIFQLMGGRCEDLPDAYADASPIEFIRNDLPPILLIEGMMDSVVPYFHGDRLVNRLSFTNTPFALLRLPWSRHGFDAVLSGLGAQLAQYHIDRFLAWSLYGDRHA